jgi:hypothetical protein
MLAEYEKELESELVFEVDGAPDWVLLEEILAELLRLSEGWTVLVFVLVVLLLALERGVSLLEFEGDSSGVPEGDLLCDSLLEKVVDFVGDTLGDWLTLVDSEIVNEVRALGVVLSEGAELELLLGLGDPDTIRDDDALLVANPL